MPNFQEALGFFQDISLFLNHSVRRKPSSGLSHAHASSGGGKTHPNGLSRLDAVLQIDPVGVDVQVITAGGATTQKQFCHGQLSRDLYHFRGQVSPNGIQTFEPTKELGVLNTWNRPGQRLNHVVVAVDHARYDHVMAGIYDLICKAKPMVFDRIKSLLSEDLFDEAVFNQNRTVLNLYFSMVLCADHLRLVNQK